MPTNIHALARLIRARQLAAMDACFPHVTFRSGSELTRNCVGIHLDSPETWEVADAARRAERDGFEAIYVYPADVAQLNGGSHA
jgi:hypothetical protein